MVWHLGDTMGLYKYTVVGDHFQKNRKKGIPRLIALAEGE